MPFYTDRRGRVRPITGRKSWRYYGHHIVMPSTKSSFAHARLPRAFKRPMPQNTIRSHFTFSDDSKKQIADDILSYAAENLGESAAKALAPVVSRFVPAVLGPNIQHEIKIEQERHGVKGSVTVSVPVDLSALPGGAVAQTIAGKPTFYVTIQSKVRLYKKKRLVATNEIRVGYSQESPLTNQGVNVEWHRTFKPTRLRLPRAISAAQSAARRS